MIEKEKFRIEEGKDGSDTLIVEHEGKPITIFGNIPFADKRHYSLELKGDRE